MSKKTPLRLTPSRTERGVAEAPESLSNIPASSKIRPLRDQLIVEPLDVVLSKIIWTPPAERPAYGIVRAAGPGTYPWRYNAEKGKRTKAWKAKCFRPNDVQVGDVVQLEPHRLFQQFYWGDRLHIICREEDVAGICNPHELDQRATA